jgi:hypothetical protein
MRISKKREYSQIFESYEKAQEEVSSTMIRKCRSAGLCMCYKKKNHDAKFCASRINIIVAIVFPFKPSFDREAGSIAFASLQTRFSQKEIEDFDSDMD